MDADDGTFGDFVPSRELTDEEAAGLNALVAQGRRIARTMEALHPRPVRPSFARRLYHRISSLFNPVRPDREPRT